MQYAVDTLEKERLRLQGVKAQAKERLTALRDAGADPAGINQEEERLALLDRRMDQLADAIQTLQEQLHTIH